MYISNYLTLTDDERIEAHRRFAQDFRGGGGRFRLEDFHRFADKILYGFFALDLFTEDGRIKNKICWPLITQLKNKNKDTRFPLFYFALSYLYGADWGSYSCPGGLFLDKSIPQEITEGHDMINILQPFSRDVTFDPDRTYEKATRFSDTNRALINAAEYIQLDKMVLKKKANGTLTAYTETDGTEFTTLKFIQYSMNGIGGLETEVCKAVGMAGPATEHLITANSTYEKKEGSNYAKADFLYKGVEIEGKLYMEANQDTLDALTKKCHNTDICFCYIISLRKHLWGIRTNGVFQFYTGDNLPDIKEKAIIQEFDYKINVSQFDKRFRVFTLWKGKNGDILVKENTTGLKK